MSCGMAVRATRKDKRAPVICKRALAPHSSSGRVRRYFAELWRGVDVGEDGSIALLSREGTLMLRSPMVEEMIGRSFADTLAFREYLTNSSAATYTATSTVDDIERIVSVRIVHDYPKLVVLVGRSVGDALADEAGAVATKILHALHLGA